LESIDSTDKTQINTIYKIKGGIYMVNMKLFKLTMEMYSQQLLDIKFPKRISLKYSFLDSIFNKEIREQKKLEKNFLKEKRYQIYKVSLALCAPAFYDESWVTMEKKLEAVNDIKEAMKLDTEYFNKKKDWDVERVLNFLKEYDKPDVKSKYMNDHKRQMDPYEQEYRESLQQKGYSEVEIEKEIEHAKQLSQKVAKDIFDEEHK